MSEEAKTGLTAIAIAIFLAIAMVIDINCRLKPEVVRAQPSECR